MKIFNEISSRVLVFFELKVCIFIFIVSFDFSELKTIACIYFTFYKIFRNFIIVLSIGLKEVTSFSIIHLISVIPKELTMLLKEVASF